MLTNVRRSPHTLRAITNGRHQDSKMVGNFPNLGQVWYNPASIANILSLHSRCQQGLSSDDGHDYGARYVRAQAQWISDEV